MKLAPGWIAVDSHDAICWRRDTVRIVMDPFATDLEVDRAWGLVEADLVWTLHNHLRDRGYLLGDECADGTPAIPIAKVPGIHEASEAAVIPLLRAAGYTTIFG